MPIHKVKFIIIRRIYLLSNDVKYFFFYILYTSMYIYNFNYKFVLIRKILFIKLYTEYNNEENLYDNYESLKTSSWHICNKCIQNIFELNSWKRIPTGNKNFCCNVVSERILSFHETNFNKTIQLWKSFVPQAMRIVWVDFRFVIQRNKKF